MKDTTFGILAGLGFGGIFLVALLSAAVDVTAIWYIVMAHTHNWKLVAALAWLFWRLVPRKVAQ